MEHNKTDVVKSDAVIIGGGPIGIHTAIRLSEAGIGVTIIEDDSSIGKPRWCTGLISEDIFDKFDISKNSLQNRLCSARVISPFGTELVFKNKKMKVCVIDRTKFDQELYDKAKKKGVKFLLSSHCSNIDVMPSFVKLSVRSRNKNFHIYAKFCVLATGIKYGLHDKLDLGLPDHFLDSVQSELITKDIDSVEIYLGSNFAPKAFAWVVPISTNVSRIGVSTDTNSYDYLMKLLNSSYLKNRIVGNKKPRIIKRRIPIGTIRKTFSDRILVVGDAAGQVKPISGGGIYYGLLSSNIASEVIISSFRQNRFDESFLSTYEVRWKEAIGLELTIGLWLRNSFNNCTDEQIDLLVKLCNQPSIRGVFEKYDYFNSHGKLFNALIRKPAFWGTIYKIYKILSGQDGTEKIEAFKNERKYQEVSKV